MILAAVIQAFRRPSLALIPAPISRHPLQLTSHCASVSVLRSHSTTMGQIRLTEQEEAICQLLDQTCEYIYREKPTVEGVDPTQQLDGNHRTKCEARLAGGWVRDKLLAKGSDDIDISLSTLTGNAFALYLKHYLTTESFARSPLSQSAFFSQGNSEISKIGKIEANPEQSKALETATATLLGLSLDFVNLRKETYDPGSRIPTMTFGTPKEDAERRDITINSMLYNVHSRQLEDHTGLGLRDLAAGLIRTPLPPLTTFLDDPLRVLRCVRFASRFAYELHPTIVRCLTGRKIEGAGPEMDQVGIEDLTSKDDPRVDSTRTDLEAVRNEIRSALVTKVSRERFGIEVDKMVKGPNPLLAVFLMHRLELFPLIFHPPPTSPMFVEQNGKRTPGVAAPDAVALNAARLLDAILKEQVSEDHSSVQLDGLKLSSHDAAHSESQAAKSATRAFSSLPQSPLPRSVFESLPEDLRLAWTSESLTSEDKRRLWISVGLLPLRGLSYEEKKNKTAWAGESVIANGLKLGTKTLKEPVAHLNRAIDILASPGRLVNETEEAVALAERHVTLPAGANVKARVGLILRNASITNSSLQMALPPALLISFIAELTNIMARSENGTDADASSLASVEREAMQVAQSYAAFWRTVNDWGLVGRAEEKPLLDGNAITAALDCHPRLISRVQIHVLAYQFSHSGTADECSAWLKTEWEKGGIVPIDERPAPIPTKGAGKKAKKVEEERDRRKRQKSE